MKKLNIVGIVLLLLFLGAFGVVGLNYKGLLNERNQRYYEKIKENIQPEIEAYVRLTHYYCNPDRGENTATTIYTDDTLIYQRGMDRKLLLDVDGESYCKVRVEVKCVAVNEFAWDTYLKCNDYEDYEYSHWDKTVEDEKKDIIEKVSFNEKEKKVVSIIYDKLNIYQYFDNDNLESLKIIKLQPFGYYESEKNILYVLVYYDLKCKDGTYSCNGLYNNKDNNNDSDISFLNFMIKVDVENFDYIEKIDRFATHINSDWIGIDDRIE